MKKIEKDEVQVRICMFVCMYLCERKIKLKLESSNTIEIKGNELAIL